jgi:pyruvate dehydrogenase E2 component (dihydrolipoamide acetyltransferase)
MRDCPEFNTYVRRGKIIERKSLDAMVSVLLKEDQMGSIKIPNAHLFRISELADFFKSEIDKARAGEENKTMQKKGLMAVLPWPFRRWLAGLVKLITVHWGLRLPGVVDANSFGSFVVTNIGTIGLDMGLPALFPISNVSMVVTLGGIYKKPVVINDEIVPRRIITIGAAIDHRVVDAMQVGKLFRYLKFAARNPSVLDEEFEAKS